MPRRRFARNIFTTLSATSLLLCIAACVLWARSYRGPANQMARRDRFDLTRSETLYWLISDPGVLALCRQSGQDWTHPLRELHAGGVAFGGGRGDDGSLLWNLRVPYWMIVTLTAAMPLLLALRISRARRARQRARQGRCPACGYDLRASPGRCPECGTAIAAESHG